MRIAIFSDIHANLNGLNAILEHIQSNGGADILIAAGDLVADGPRPVQTFDRLLEVGCLMIRGNHEEYMLGKGKETIPSQYLENIWIQNQWAAEEMGKERMHLIENLPCQLFFSPPGDLSGHDLLVVHTNTQDIFGQANHDGIPEENLETLYGNAPTGTQIIAFGHWHYPSIRPWKNFKLVNIASVAYPKDRAKLASYTMFDWDRKKSRWKIRQVRVGFNWQEEAYFLRKCDMPGNKWHIEHFYSDNT